MTKESGELIQEVDVLDLIKKIGTKNKVAQAIILQKLEELIPEREKYQEARKVVLDELNSLTRSFVKYTFGDIEFLVK